MPGGSARAHRVEHVMGFPVSVDVRRPPRRIESTVDAVFELLHAADRRFSTYRPDSEVCRLRRGELSVVDCHPTVREVLALCRMFTQRSFGAFRATLPGAELDPSGIVKGWAVQRAADLLKSAGANDFCLNAGGDVITAGEPEPGRRWQVGIRHPDRADAVCAVFAVRDAAVATSGAYERGAHIVNGNTGRPPHGLRSMTVVADDLILADGTATAAFAMGADGPGWAARQPGCLVYAVTDTGQVLRSAELADALVPASPAPTA